MSYCLPELSLQIVVVVVVSVLPLAGSWVLCSPFYLVSAFLFNTTLRSETHLANPIVFFPLVFFLSSDPLSPPLGRLSPLSIMTDPVFLPTPDLTMGLFFLYQLH